MVRESRHLWVGNLPESVREEQIQDYFSRYGRVEKVKLLPKTSPDGGRAAFVDFVDIRSATKANEAPNRMGERDLRTNYNEPGKGPEYRNNNQINPNIHRVHGGYPPPGMEFRGQPVVIYAAPPPTEHLIHASPAYRPMFPREGRLQPSFQPRRGRSPGSRGSLSDGDRSPSPGNRSDSSDTDDVDGKSSKKTTVIVKNLLARTNDASLEEALYHEFKKYGEIMNITIKGSGPDRYANVKFMKSEEAEDATHSSGKLFLGQDMKVSLRGRQKRASPDDSLEFDPHATRTVFVGNLEKTMMHGELRGMFETFGDVVDVDIKKMQTGVTTYAFVQYIDLNGAMLAKRKMDRQYIGHNRIKVGYGRGTPTNSLWVGNLPPQVADHQVSKAFHPFGYVQRCLIDKHYCQALVRFETIESATRAFADMHGKSFMGKRLAVDYASPACRDGFYGRMEKNGLLDRRQLEPSPTPPDAHLNFQNIARGAAIQRGGDSSYSLPRPTFVPAPPYIPRDVGPKDYDYRGDRYTERPKNGVEYERRDYYGRDKFGPERTGQSPMSRHSRESISPVSSAGFYKVKYEAQLEKEKKKKRKRNAVDTPLQISDEPPKKKEKKKKKDKKVKTKKLAKGSTELACNGKAEEEEENTTKKSKSQTRKERKERKKTEKTRKKAERKEKKLSKLKDMEERLKSIQTAVAAEAFENTKDENIDSEKELKKEIKAESMPYAPADMSEVSDSSQLAEPTQEVKVKMEEVSEENTVNTEHNLVEGEVIAKIELKTEPGEVNGENDGPRSPSPVPDEKSPAQPKEVKKPDKKKADSSDSSSSSSSSSSESEDSDDSSDDDDKDLKHRSYRKTKEQRRSLQKKDEKSREPKAYRQESREELERQRERSREKYYGREYDKSKYGNTDTRRSPRSYSRRSNSQERFSEHSKSPRRRSRSRSPYKRDDSYDRRRGRSPSRKSPRSYERSNPRSERPRTSPPPPPPPGKDAQNATQPIPNQPGYKSQNSNTGQSADTLLDLLRRFPVMWQGLLGLKNDTAAVQMHFLSGNVRLGEGSLPRAAQPNEVPPPLRISQRMKLEASQLEGVDKRIAQSTEHCMLLALPCGRDPLDVHAQTRALKTGFITYLQQKQAAGIINVSNPTTKQPAFVVHIFPPCEFAQGHLARVAPDLLDSAADSGHLMVLVTPA